MKIRKRIIIIAISLLVIAIVVLLILRNQGLKLDTNGEDIIPYDLGEPADIKPISGDFKSISGIAYYKNKKIAFLNSSDAIIHMYNTQKKEFTGSYNFGSKGNYHDIAILGEDAWIIKDDGRIYYVKNFKDDNRIVEKYRTALNAANIPDGIVPEPEGGDLLIACRGLAYVEKFTNIVLKNKLKGSNAIYRYDFQKKDLDLEPVYTVSSKEVLTLLSKSEENKKNTSEEKELLFNPVSIARHPVTGEIYSIYESGTLLIVFNNEGGIRDIKRLNKKVFKSPSGITFSDDGDLYVVVRDENLNTSLLQFTYKLKKPSDKAKTKSIKTN